MDAQITSLSKSSEPNCWRVGFITNEIDEETALKLAKSFKGFCRLDIDADAE